MDGKDQGKTAAGRPPVSARLASKQAANERPPQPLGLDDRPTSPLVVLQLISGEAVRVANEAIQNVYNGGSDGGDSSPLWAGNQQSPRESTGRGHRRSTSLQNLKSHFQRALRWGGSSQEESKQRHFNPEELANQKRQWYQLQSNTPDHTQFKEPTALFEHFAVVGLQPDANLAPAEEVFAMKKRLELEMMRAKPADKRNLQRQIPSPPSLEAQMLFKYPLGKKLPMRSIDLCSFCFPGGVKAQVVERTPSLSDLNELVYGREHLGNDTSAFIFSLKGADNATLYGVCLLVPEIVQRSPAILGGSSPICHGHAASRFLVSAPRCYCLLTRVPFFELHYEMLNSIVAQERLNRITQFVSEINLPCNIPYNWRLQDRVNSVGGFPDKDSAWMLSAIPLDSTIVLAAAAAGIIPDDEVESSSNKLEGAHSPCNVAASDASFGLPKEMDKDDKMSQCSDDHASFVSEQPNGFERSYENSENGMFSPGRSVLSCSSSPKLERSSSAASLFSSARSLEDEDDAYSSAQESDISGDFMNTDWAKANMNDFLKMLGAYGALSIPARGSEIVFHPLEHLQAIQYRRSAVSELGVAEEFLVLDCQDPLKLAEVNAKLAVVEDAFALSVWTTATVCRVLCLDNVLALVTGALLEKQVALTCPNLGVLSAVVLCLIPMIRPFEWQSLMLPILPEKMLDFLEAPVPFLVGLEKKPSGLRIKTDNLVHVDVFKDQVKLVIGSCKSNAARILVDVPRFSVFVLLLLGNAFGLLVQPKTVEVEYSLQADRKFLTPEASKFDHAPGHYDLPFSLISKIVIIAVSGMVIFGCAFPFFRRKRENPDGSAHEISDIYTTISLRERMSNPGRSVFFYLRPISALTHSPTFPLSSSPHGCSLYPPSFSICALSIVHRLTICFSSPCLRLLSAFLAPRGLRYSVVSFSPPQSLHFLPLLSTLSRFLGNSWPAVSLAPHL